VERLPGNDSNFLLNLAVVGVVMCCPAGPIHILFRSPILFLFLSVAPRAFPSIYFSCGTGGSTLRTRKRAMVAFLPAAHSRRRYRSVYISPHVDDVVFSCGGSLARAEEMPESLVIYIFSESGRGTEKRKREEEHVARMLGYDYHFLGFDDLFRRDPAGRLSPRMKRLLQNHHEPDLRQRIQQELRTVLTQVEFDSVFLPLGVGMHFDHQICFELYRAFTSAKNTFFYEDIPYLLAPGVLEARLQYLTGQALTIPGRPALTVSQQDRELLGETLLPNPRSSALLYKLLRGPLGTWGARLMRRRLESLRGGREEPDRLRLQAAYRSIEQGLDRKVEGSWRYESQVRQFFETKNTLRELLHLTHSLHVEGKRGLYERVWRLDPRP